VNCKIGPASGEIVADVGGESHEDPRHFVRPFLPERALAALSGDVPV
jgi:hypothetical protein